MTLFLTQFGEELGEEARETETQRERERRKGELLFWLGSEVKVQQQKPNLGAVLRGRQVVLVGGKWWRDYNGCVWQQLSAGTKSPLPAPPPPRLCLCGVPRAPPTRVQHA